MSDHAIALYGTNEPAAEERVLRAGPLTAIFDNGALRNITLAGVEVIRGISFLIRDRNWATVVPELRDLEIQEDERGFRISFTAHGRTPSDGQVLDWHGRIEGSATRGLAFHAHATPEQEVVTCRTGFVILHPLEKVVGCPVTIEHTDGRIEETAFPDLIDPLQCFFDIRAMTHEPLPGIKATCRMEGGAWETEDHRNWLDASFKTYFRPLALPWPYKLPAGERLEQSVTLSFSGQPGAIAARTARSAVQIAVGDRTGLPMPAIALAVAPEDLDAALAEAEALLELGCQGFSVRLAPETRDFPGVLRKAARLEREGGAAGHLEIVVSGKQPVEIELDLIATAAASAGFEPASVMVSPAVDLKSYPPSVDRPGGPPLAQIYAAVRTAFPGIELGGGMFSYFTELNRRRPPAHLLDFVQHATSSIVHAADDRSVMETLEALPHVFRSVRALKGDARYRIGPANIGMPFNPYGASTTPNPDNRRLSMVSDDPRQKGLFGAAWAAGYLARAGQGGVDAVTIMAPTGPFGLLGEAGPRPAFAVVQAYSALAGAAVLQCASSDPQNVLACAAEQEGRRTLILANLTPCEQPVAVSGFRTSARAVLSAESGSAFAALSSDGDAIVLPPYGVARLEG